MFKLLFRFFYHPGRWIPFTLIYLAVFFISFFSLMTVADEYDGGNWAAEAGATLFYYFEFPIFTIWSWMGGLYNSSYDSLIWVLVIVNLLINYLLTVLLVSALFRLLKKK